MNPDFHQLQQSRLVLQARLAETKRSYESLRSQVAHHQARLNWQPDVKAVLDALQKKEHERTVGAYEQLLSALMQDVLPGPRELVMDLHTHGGVPALDLYIRKGNGPLEDALHGTGGSVTNILSAGLRAIALVRSGKRRFMVMDEADCWIKPAWAPRFAEVIQQLAEELNVQILMISHHPETLFPMIRHKLLLERGADGLHAQWSPSSDIPVWEEDQEGIRSITLEDFQSHKFTHISLSPGVTFLSGDNDIGKSAVVRALRSVFLGEGSSTAIRHGQKSTRVTLDFGPQHFLQWERFAKGKVIETYRHYKADQGPEHSIQATDGAKTAPDWLEPTFGIGLIDGLDVQLCHQKEPIFLLNKPSTMRAKALAIGDDAGHVQAMLSIDKRETAEARSTIKNGEKTLERMSRTMLVLSPIQNSQDDWEQVQGFQQAAQERQTRLEEARHLLERWARAQSQAAALEGFAVAEPVEVPILKSNPEWGYLAQRWKGSQRKLDALTSIAQSTFDTSVPVLQAPAAADLERRWRRSSNTQQALASVVSQPLPALPQPSLSPGLLQLESWWHRNLSRLDALKDLVTPFPSLPSVGEAVGALRELGQRWEGSQRQLQECSHTLKKVSDDEQALRHHKALCPTCGQVWQPAG